MSTNGRRREESQPSTPSSHHNTTLSYQAFISDLAKTSPLRTLDSLVLEDDFTIDGPTIISELALFLTILRVPGPCIFFSDADLLGEGAHFAVFKDSIAGFAEFAPDDPSLQNSVQVAAVKKPKFLLDADRRLDLSDSLSSSRQVRSIMLEITALCHPRLWGHPNIVDLLAWGSSPEDWHNVPFIALEVADMDLAMLLQNEQVGSPVVKLDLVQDVACGLDAIHEIGLVHGDLKPANVLIFGKPDAWVAKLADFGGAANVSKDGFWEGGGTVGWRAPEVSEFYGSGKALDMSVLDRADNYSFGLLLWSIFLREKAAAPHDESDTGAERMALADLHANRENVPAFLTNILKNSFSSLLKLDPRLRNDKIESLLDNRIQEQNDRRIRAHLEQQSLDVFRHDYSDNAQIDWDMPEISENITPGLKAAFTRGGNLPSEMLHALIVKVLSQGHNLDLEIDDRNLLLDLLCAAARQGQRPSKSIIFRIYEYFDLNPPPDISSAKLSWIADSVSEGAFFLRSELQQMDADIYAKSIASFRTSGGFNSPHATSPLLNSLSTAHEVLQNERHELELTSPLNSHGENALHIAAASDQSSILSELLCRSSPRDINSSNAFGETPLYKACKNGSASNVLQLLSHGADASIRVSEDGPGCLHWIFHFDASDINHIVDELIRHNAGVHIQSKQKIAILGPPFTLPVGTALHWAVEMSVPKAVSALLRHGADPCVRDGRDPYEYDNSVRDLDRILPPDNTPFAVAVRPTMGLNAFDLAVHNMDNSILGMLLSRASVHDVADQVDEEGYSALHRLDAGSWLRTRQGTRIWKPCLRGSRRKQKEATALTVALLRDHGFQLDRLTKPQQPALKGLKFARLTPLMLAVRHCNVMTAEALVETGASVDVCNDRGRTALHAFNPSYANFPSHQSAMISILLRSNPDVNLQSMDDDSPLAMVARLRLTKVGLALLERGADFCVRCSNPGDIGYGQNVLAVFCRCEMEDVLKRDEWMTMVLAKFVIPQLLGRGNNMSKRIEEEVLTNAGINGGNFLHFAASGGLAACCRLLLERGLVDCNQLRRSSKRRYRNGVRGIVTQYQTPLDEALKGAKSARRREKTRFSGRDLARFMLVFEKTTEVIRTHGGVRASTFEPKRFEPGTPPAFDLRHPPDAI